MASVRVVLSGGPVRLPESARVQEVNDLTEKVKIVFASGYEHFADSGEMAEIDGDRLPVFEWCGRTMMAE
ncbi:DUF5988 family protein [Amycolatopsis cihanbeyliensis]|uniref:Uncharacterized protein n=1 Tax=Amycolatopsis cihanbeyliensis TaxID=1128664 RepID=A0A542CS66_AMYCI|nr:DUF5988 family protein [Amycolatopsis cihanbeyliensis]TQI93665.1 hypothetical protein FB471_5805 [Amycolatopsis cihanbeyliensis]